MAAAAARRAFNTGLRQRRPGRSAALRFAILTWHQRVGATPDRQRAGQEKGHMPRALHRLSRGERDRSRSALAEFPGG